MSTPLYRRVENSVLRRIKLSQRVRSLADTGHDYADKNWLRPTRGMLRRLVANLWDMTILLLILLAIGYVIQHNEARASDQTVLMLEASMLPASPEECRAARPDLGYPDRVTSKQNGSGTPWHHRTCWWSA